MPVPPRRKRFQIHLSTAIVLLFVAGGLMWANLYERIPGYRGVPFIYAYPGEIMENLNFTIGPVEPIFLGLDCLLAFLILAEAAFVLESLANKKSIIWTISMSLITATIATACLFALSIFLYQFVGHRTLK